MKYIICRWVSNVELICKFIVLFMSRLERVNLTYERQSLTLPIMQSWESFSYLRACPVDYKNKVGL